MCRVLQNAIDEAVELQLQGKAGQAPEQPPAANGQGAEDPISAAATAAAVQAATLANPHAQQAALAAWQAKQVRCPGSSGEGWLDVQRLRLLPDRAT
jgi:hypothetical protein